MILLFIDPDLKQLAGHQFGWARSLSQFYRGKFDKLVVLANKDAEGVVEAELADGRDSEVELVPAFTDNTYFANSLSGRANTRRFEDEFRLELNGVLEKNADENIVVYMYSGSLFHARAIVEVIKQHPKVRAHVSLFWESVSGYEALLKRKRIFASVYMHPQLALCAPTLELALACEESLGFRLPVASHPPVSKRGKFRSAFNAEVCQVCIFTSTAPDKGIVEMDDLVTEVKYGRKQNVNFTFRVSHQSNDAAEQKRIIENKYRNVDSDIRFIVGHVDNETFDALLSAIHIGVIPYKSFEYRTSGIFLDCMAKGIIPIVRSGSWMANIVGRYACGVVLTEFSSDEVMSAVGQIADNYKQFKQNLAEAQKAYASANNWPLLIDELAACSNGSLVALQPNQKGTLNELKALAAYFKRVGKTKLHIVDVGAHKLEVVSHFKNHIGKYFGFEANKKNYRAAIKTIDAKPKHKLSLAAVSSKSGKKISFFEHTDSSGAGSVVQYDTEKLTKANSVETVALSDFIKSEKLNKIDFLKIDVEGNEPLVLQGMNESPILPEVIMVEFDDEKTRALGKNYKDLLKKLESFGYFTLVFEWHPVQRMGGRHSFKTFGRYENMEIAERAWGNLIGFTHEVARDEFEAFCVSWVRNYRLEIQKKRILKDASTLSNLMKKMAPKIVARLRPDGLLHTHLRRLYRLIVNG